MATFSPASQDVSNVIAEIVEEFYPDLVEAGAKINAVFAYPTLDRDGEPTGPAMVKDERQIFARIKKNSEEDRCAGKADATITIDHAEWDRLDGEDDGHAQKRALIDHELHHLVVRRDKQTGEILTDDRDRPLFKIKPHDWEITGFRAVAARHGRHSYEKQQARRFHDTFGNLLFDFASDRADRQEQIPGVEAEKPRRRKGAAVVSAANR